MNPVLTIHLLIYLGGSTLVALHHYLSPLLASLLFFCLLLPSPFFLPQEQRLHRAITCFTTGFYFCRLSTVAPSQPLWLKIAHVFGTFMDTNTIAKQGPLDVQERQQYTQQLRHGSLYAVPFTVLVAVAHHLFTEGPLTAQRLAVAILCAGASSVFFLTAFGHLLIGGWGLSQHVRLPWLMRAPAMATSLREFWGRRWNGVVQRMLKTTVYDRCAGPSSSMTRKTLASVLTFMVSGAIHAYPVYVAHVSSWHDVVAPGTLYPVLWALAYFVVQCVLMFVQDACGPWSGGVVWQRAATMFGVVLPAPLLVVVFVALPYSPDDPVVQQCTHVVQTKAFLWAWLGVSGATSVVVGVGAELR